jgi:hypothetical protein
MTGAELQFKASSMSRQVPWTLGPLINWQRKSKNIDDESSVSPSDDDEHEEKNTEKVSAPTPTAEESKERIRFLEHTYSASQANYIVTVWTQQSENALKRINYILAFFLTLLSGICALNW